MSYKFTNKAIAFLDTAFGSTANIIVLPSGTGDLFPSITGDEMFAVVFEDRLTGEFEICYCTSRTGDQLTVTRGEEGTTATSWPVGSNVSLRTSAAFLNEVGAHESRITQNEADIAQNAADIIQLQADLDPLVTTLLERIYPVGSLYSSTLSTNPGTTMAFGTWVAHAQGRALVGVGNNGQTTWAQGDKRGSETHTLTTAQMPSHTHGSGSYGTNSAGNHRHSIPAIQVYGDQLYSGSANNAHSNGTQNTGYAGSHSHSVNGTSGSSGGGSAHNNVQPSIAIYVWKRTA